jgi:hypothetical protein
MRVDSYLANLASVFTAYTNINGTNVTTPTAPATCGQFVARDAVNYISWTVSTGSCVVAQSNFYVS